MPNTLSNIGSLDKVIHTLQPFWQTLSQFTQAQTHDAVLYALQHLCEKLNAKNAYWICTVKMGETNDSLHGWRPVALEYLHNSPQRQSIYNKHQALIKAGEFDVSLIKNIEGHGNFRVNIQSENVPESWYQSNFYQQLYAPYGVDDLLCLASPISDDIECWLCFERHDPQNPRFNRDEQHFLHLAGAPLTWLLKQMALTKGIGLVNEPLTPSEKKVLHDLLLGKSEQEIASKIQLAPTTVHTYATRIYRKYGVKGRKGLMAAWLSY